METAGAADWNSNMPGYVPVSGTWSEIPGDGLKGVSGSGTNSFNLSTTKVGTNFTYEADVKVDASTPFGVGSLVFRATADGSKGYVVQVDPNMDRIRLFDFGTGTDLGTPYAASLDPGTYYHLKVVADGTGIKVYLGAT